MIKTSSHRLPKPFTVRLSGGCKLTYTYRPRKYLSRLATILMIMVGAYPAQALDINALPQGGSVSTGSAAIVQGDGRLDINQTTQNVSINWDSFNIGSNAQVNFHQPSSDSVALNRVIGSSGASEIFGHLTSNGYVFLLNPNGVLFSQNAQVNVGGLVASTMGLSDADFMAKRYSFSGNGSFSSVINQGVLTASEGGYIALLAPEVRNEGIITAYLGTVVLGAGEQITLDFSGNRLVNLAVDQSAIRALVENRQMIQADGGTVILAAKAEGNLSATVVNNEGIIRAQSIGNVSGVIRLEGGTEGVVSVAGILDTSGKGLGETGGSIYVLGDKVGLFAGSSLDASGDTGGGTVLVGGDFQGKNLNIQNASFSYVDQGAIINADAISNGNGGKVIVWANDSTRFYGGITAQGGSRGGDGGFTEVSGKQNLTFAGNANLGSLAGKSGTLLMDPNDLYVNTGSVSGSVQDASGPFQAIDGVNNYYVLTSSLSGDTSYTLQASHDVIFNSGVTFGNTGSNTVSITATNNIASNLNNVATSGGALSFNSATMSLGAINTLGGALTLNSISMAIGAVNTSGGLLTINDSGAATQTGAFTGAGGVTKMGTGTLTLSQSNSYTGATTISAGTVSLQGSNKLANGSNLVLDGGTFDMNTRSETVNGVKLVSGSITGTVGILTSATTFDMQSGTVSAILKGSAVGLTKTTVGTVTLSGLNLYTGLTTVTAGTLAYGINNALSTGAVTVSGGALSMGAFSDTVGTVTLSSGSITGTTGVLTGTSYAMQSGTASVILSGAGTLTKTTSGTVTLSGANTYSGATSINVGTLSVTNSTALGSTSGTTTVLSGATLDINNVAIGLEAITLNGMGVSAGGALTGTGTASLTGPITLASNSSIDTGAGDTLTVGGTINGLFSLDVIGSGSVNLGSSVGGTTALASFSGSSGVTLAVNGGLVKTSGSQLYNGPTTLGGATTLQTAGGDVTATGAMNATAGVLTISSGVGSATFNNAANNFGTVQVTSGGAVSLVDSNAMTVGSSVLSSLTARTITGDLTLGGGITASGGSDSIVLAAGGNFNNTGSFTLTPGTGRWLVYTSDPAAATFGGLSSGNLALWNRNYVSNPSSSITQTGNRYLFGTNQTLTFTSGSLTKVYGDNVTSSLPTLYTSSVANSNTYGGVIIADSSVALSSLFSGGVGVSSSGGVSGANVSGSPYIVTVSSGTLSSLTGYGTAFISTGAITVTPYVVSLSGSRIYDGTTTASSSMLSLSSLVGSETLVLSGSGVLSNKNVGTGKTFSLGSLALGNGSGLASNYTFTGGTELAAITAKSLVISAAGVNRTYDGTTSATVTLSDNRIAGDTFTDSYISAAFLTKDAATGKSVTATGLSFSGADAGNYTLSSATASTTAAIAAKSLVISAAGVNRTYDGTTSATVTLSDNRIAGDSFTDSYISAAFLTKDAATGKSVAATGLSFSGADAGNYTLSSATAATTAAIAAKSLTISATGVNRTYDGTTSATVTLSDNRIAGDSFTDSFMSAAFLTKDAATGKSVAATGLSFSGADAGNYTLSSATAATTAAIAAKSLTISAAGVNRTYDGTTSATVTLSDNRIAGDSFTDSYTSAAFLTKDAATGKSVTATGLSLAGVDAGNYTLGNSTAATTANITAKSLTISATGVNRTYDGTTSATVTLSDNRIAGDSFTDSFMSAAFLTKDAATGKSVIATGLSFAGTDAGNYTLANSTAATTANVSAKALTISAIGINRSYDGSTAATVMLNDNRVAGDVLTDNYTEANFITKDVGISKSVTATGLSLAGVDASNYILGNSTATTTANIIARELSVIATGLNINATGVNRIYDGTTAAMVTLTDNRVVGDVLTDNYMRAYFQTKDVGIDKKITAEGLNLSGVDADNYMLSSTTIFATADISARTLFIDAAGVNRIYDGTTAATVTLSDNRVFGDSFTDSYTSATFLTKDVATGKSVTAMGLSFSGVDAGNYTLSSDTAATTANIATRALIIDAAGVNRIYDGTTVATVTLSDNRVAGDTFTDIYTSAAFLSKDVAVSKSVTATGLSVTGSDAANYSLSNITAATTANITARALIIGAAGVSRTYDGSTAASVTLSDNRIAGDTFTDSYTSATFLTKDVATGKSVTATGLSFSGTDAANYSLSSITAATTAAITARALTIGAIGINRIYDGTTAATVALSDNRVAGDSFTDSYTSAAFLTKDAATGKSVTATGLSFTGNDSGNYTLGNSTSVATANIAAKALTISAIGINRIYDGTTAATVSLSDNRIAGDSFTDSYTSAAFLTKDAATGKSVTATGLSFSGADAGNYTLGNSTVATTANIATKSLTINAAGVNQIYDGTTVTTVTLSDNRVAGDSFTDSYTSAAFLTKDVATGKSVTATGLSVTGSDAANYSLSSITAATTANIATRALIIGAAGVNRTYDGTTTSTVMLNDNRIFGDSLTDSYTSATFLTKDVATGKSVTATGLSFTGIDSGNYTLTNATAATTAAIAAKELTISAVGINRIYDGTTAATVTLSDNRVAGDSFTDSYTSAAFMTKDAATGKSVTATGLSLSGVDAGNYALINTTAATTAAIAAKELTISAVGVNRTYDGTTAATVTLTDNRVAGDSFTNGYTSAAFLTKDVAIGKSVTATGLSVTGTDAANYSLNSMTAATTANITARTLIIDAAGVNRIYDGTTAATVTLSDNRVAGDSFTNSYAGADFLTKEAATGKSVTATGLSFSGADAANYTLGNGTVATTANIITKALTINAAGVNQIYDGTTVATVTLSDNRVAGDSFTDSYTSAAFLTKDVATGKSVTATGLSFSGADAANYSLSSMTAATTADIAARALIIGATGVSRIYDGTTAGSVTLSDNRVAGDAFTDSYTSAAFLNKDVATGKSVTATGLSFTGTDAANYSLSSITAATTANITAKSLMISATGMGRIYDGTTAATVTLSDNRVAGDTFTDNYTSAAFLTKDATSGKAVSATGLSFSGVDAGNYILSSTTTATTADILARSLTISSIGVNRTYDGSTAAAVTLSDNRIAGDSFTDSYTSASFLTKDAATGKSVTAMGLSLSGSDAANYSLSSATAVTTANIVARALTMSAAGVNRIYDGTTAATVTLSDNRVAGDVLIDNSTAATFDTKNVGTGKVISATGLRLAGADASNYILTDTTVATTAAITTRSLTINATGINRFYDGTTGAMVTLSDNRISGDLFTDSYTSASFLTKDVGMGKSVTAMGLSFSGPDSGNYAFANRTAETTADIKAIVAASNNNSLRDSSVGMTANMINGSPSHPSFEAVSQNAQISVDSILLVRSVLIPGPAPGNRSFVRDKDSDLWPAGN